MRVADEAPRDPHRELALAIVGQAVADYRRALRESRHDKAHEIEDFFRGDWFALLGDGAVDGESVVRELRRRTGLEG